MSEQEMLADLAEICRRHLQISATRSSCFKGSYDDYVTITFKDTQEVVIYYLYVGHNELRVALWRENNGYVDLFWELGGKIKKARTYNKGICEILLKSLSRRMVLDCLAQVEKA